MSNSSIFTLNTLSGAITLGQYYWNLIIRLFSVISWTLVEGVLPLYKDAVDSPNRLGHEKMEFKQMA